MGTPFSFSKFNKSPLNKNANGSLMPQFNPSVHHAVTAGKQPALNIPALKYLPHFSVFY